MKFNIKMYIIYKKNFFFVLNNNMQKKFSFLFSYKKKLAFQQFLNTINKNKFINLFQS